MLKFILLFIALWLAVRFLARLIRISYTVIGGRQDERRANRSPNFSSSRNREAVEEAEFEVIDSHIKQKD